MSYLSNFSHIYIEDRAKNYKLTKEILDKLDSKIISINHYKDVFNRYNQDYRLQKNSMKLILAVKESNFLYEASSLIQTQNYQNFFYTPTILNCIYDCHYCFLQGMYPSSNIVLFVNIEDFFDEVEKKLKTLNRMFLSISYDTDILAFEKLFGISKKWIEFSQNFNNLELEIRTKSVNYKTIKNLEFNRNIHINWTLSPEEVVARFEDKTPSLDARLKSIKSALDDNRRVNLVIDPVVKIDNYKNKYSDFFKEIDEYLSLERVESFIIGVFRISNQYLKKIKKSNLDSEIVFYPYKIDNQVASYADSDEILDFIIKELLKYVKRDKILTL